MVTNNFDPTKYGATKFDPTQYGATPIQGEATPTQDIVPKTTGFQPSFPITGKENIVTAPLKAVGNIPKSAYDFGKGILNLLNPINTLTTIGNVYDSLVQGGKESGISKTSLLLKTFKEMPQSAYEVLTPRFLKQAFEGNIDDSLTTIIEDPVGQLAPILLLARAGAKKAGLEKQFDAMIKKTTFPIMAPVKIVGQKITSGIGSLGSQALGVTTGVGKMPIQEAYKAGQIGLKGTPLSETMRGKVEPNAVVDTAFTALNEIKEMRQNQYIKDLESLPKKIEIDIKPIKDVLSSQLKNYRIKVLKNGELDFSNSPLRNTPEAISDIKTIYEDVRNWKDNTPVGVDSLKRGIDLLYSPTGKARGFVEVVKNSVKNTLVKQVPQYQKLTSNYAKMSDFLNELKRGLSLGGKAGTDTVLRKIISTVRDDNAFRYQLISKLEELGKQELTQQAAGTMLNQLVAKGLIGRGTEVGAATAVIAGLFSPKVLFGLLATSPRIVGEFVNALGFSSAKTKSFLRILNNLAPSVPPLVPKNQR